MPLKLYNTLSKKVEDFHPIIKGEVSLYLCGPTVYDYLHIGNFRGPIVFNMMRNWMEKIGFKVTFVYNYTDVDDKIINKSIEEGVESSTIAERYIQIFEEDFSRLGLRPHDHNPRVTEHIDDIIEMIQRIIKNGSAYLVDGEVFFEVASFHTYSDLSGRKLDEQRAGQRVEVDPKKRNPADFVLWKPSKEGEPSWDSPWGVGRPGWHIECSAMIHSIFGDSIDIHGGGVDLIFPHHTNEIAQAEAACQCKPFAKYWVHNNFLNYQDVKMSKSLGNIIKARDFMDLYHPEVFVYSMLSAHYRSLFSMNDERINDSFCALERIYSAKDLAENLISLEGNAPPLKDLLHSIERGKKEIADALNDDFNSPKAISSLFEIVRSFNAINFSKKSNKDSAPRSAQIFLDFLDEIGGIFSLFSRPGNFFLNELDEILLRQRKIKRAEVEELIEKRIIARKDKNWALSDDIRDELTQMGVRLQDGNEKAPWRMAVESSS